jgi:CHAT domain-containing protein
VACIAFAAGVLGAAARSASAGDTTARVGTTSPVDSEGTVLADRLAVGRALLSLGDFEGAVPALQSVLEETPTNPDLLVDMAAALLGRAETARRPEDLLEAYTFAERAVSARADSPKALRIRAQCIEALFLLEQAAQEWQAIAVRTAEPADLARASRLRALLEAASPLPQSLDLCTGDTVPPDDPCRREVSVCVSCARRHLVETALPGWADAQRAGDEKVALSRLADALRLATALEDVAADGFSKATVETIARAGEEGRDDERLRELAEAHLDFARALELLDKFDIAAAGALFARSEAVFEVAGSPMSLWCRYGRAVCDYYAENRSQASALLATVATGAQVAGAEFLEASAHGMSGLLALTSGDPPSALPEYDRAAALYEAAGDDDSALYTRNLVAEAFNFLGDTRAEWRARVAILSKIEQVRDGQIRESILFDTATSAYLAGHPEVALRFQNASLEIARARGQAVEIADNLLWRARILAAAGRLQDAAADLKEASEKARSVDDPSLALQLHTEALIAAQDSGLAGSPREAIANLDAALARQKATGTELLKEELLLARGRARLRIGETRAARRDFLAAIQSFERHPASDPGSSYAVSWSDRAREAYEEMVALYARDPRDSEEAFDYADRSRVRTLGRVRAGATTLPSVSKLRSTLPSGTVVLSYFCLPDRIVAWSLDREGLNRVVLEIPRARLAEMVGGLLASMDRPDTDEAVRARAAELFDELVLPFYSALASARRIVIVPDGPIASIPYASLWDSREGSYLVEHASLVIVPAVRMLLPGTEGAPIAVATSGEGSLVIGNPRFDPRIFPSLPDLPGAEAEARLVASLIHGSTLLTREQATAVAIQAAAGAAPIVHFAGHAIVNQDHPELSHLVLAAPADGSNSGALLARDVEGWALPRTRLVVLAGCETASGRLFRGEGLLSMARSFLAAGVPVVIGSLRPLDDEASARFFGEMYQRIAGGEDPVEALRDTQLWCLRGKDPALGAPRLWSTVAAVTNPGAALAEGGMAWRSN